jgi:hypothetical protein
MRLGIIWRTQDIRTTSVVTCQTSCRGRMPSVQCSSPSSSRAISETLMYNFICQFCRGHGPLGIRCSYMNAIAYPCLGEGVWRLASAKLVSPHPRNAFTWRSGWEAVRDWTPFHEVALPFLEDIRGGHERPRCISVQGRVGRERTQRLR